ncbi:MAG: hypothetical protein LBU32_32665 [Clostridiales bacterium]|jgi:hypothetical protein|nr:hypothetical protein [Clostridiales bacterium]
MKARIALGIAVALMIATSTAASASTATSASTAASEDIALDFTPKDSNVDKYVLTVVESGQYCVFTDDGNGSPFNVDYFSNLIFTPFFEGLEEIGIKYGYIEYGYIEDGICFAASQLPVKSGITRVAGLFYDSTKSIKFYIKNMGGVPISLHNLKLYTK